MQAKRASETRTVNRAYSVILVRDASGTDFLFPLPICIAY